MTRKKPYTLVASKRINTDYIQYYEDLKLGWGFCTRPDIKGVSMLLTPFGYCRECLTGYMWGEITSEKKRRKYNIDLNKIRLVARIVLHSNKTDSINNTNEKVFFKGLDTGLRIVNILEERNGWPLSKMHSINSEKIHKMLRTKMIIGSARWLRSAHMLSMYCLLFRVAAYSDQFKSIKNFKNLNKAMEKYGTLGAVKPDRKYIYHAWPYIDALMANFDSFFKGLPLRRNWTKPVDEDPPGNTYYNEGIDTLSLNRSINEKISHRFKVLKAKVRNSG